METILLIISVVLGTIAFIWIAIYINVGFDEEQRVYFDLIAECDEERLLIKLLPDKAKIEKGVYFVNDKMEGYVVCKVSPLYDGDYRLTELGNYENSWRATREDLYEVGEIVYSINYKRPYLQKIWKVFDCIMLPIMMIIIIFVLPTMALIFANELVNMN